MRTGTPRMPPATGSVTKGLQTAQVGDDRVDLVRVELLAEHRHPTPLDALGLRRGAVDPEVDPVVGVRRVEVLEILARRPVGDVVQVRTDSTGQVLAVTRRARRR